MLRLDPAATPVWRSPDDLQFGVDPPLAVVRGARTATLRLIGHLTVGCERPRLEAVARAWCLPEGALDALLTTLEPALEHPSPEERVAVSVDGPPDLVALLGGVPAEPGAAAPVVLAAHHALPPVRHLRWLRADVPHLPVVFGDASVVVGPIVRPGVTACLRCADEHRIDADPAWPAVAGQLLRRTSSRTAEDPVVARSARRAVRRVLLDGALAGALRVEESGISAVPAPAPHPRCSCAGLAQAPTAPGRPRSG